MNGPRPIRLAVVLSGAVSLGSFEAGVMHELLAATERGAPLEIDVIAGTSAGALVGAVVTRSLVTGAPYEDGLKIWTGVTLDALTHFQSSDERNQGLLSAAALWKLQQEKLVKQPASRTFQPACPAPRVALLMTLTNLDGLSDPADPSRIRFDEDVTFLHTLPNPLLPAQTPYITPIWERTGLIAQASAAFPAAFDPIKISWHDRVQAGYLCVEIWRYQNTRESLEKAFPGMQNQMHYADGGILDQQPLGRALETLPRLICPLGPEALHRLLFDPDRRVLFVEPDPPQVGLMDGRQEPNSFENIGRSLRLWSLSSSPQFSNLGDPENNQRQSQLLTIVADMAEAMTDGSTEANLPSTVETMLRPRTQPEPVPPWLEPTIEQFYAWITHPARDLDALLALPTTNDVQQESLKEWVGLLHRLRAAYLRVGQVAEGAHHQSVLRQLHLNLAGRLDIRFPWVLVDWISPPDPEGQLWGEQVVHFGGFLSREFLQHDFDVGRAYANNWLQQVVPAYANPAAPEPPLPSNVGITPGLLLHNARPMLRVGRRLLRNIGRSLGMGDKAASVWSYMLYGGAFISIASSLIYLTRAWWQMLEGDRTDPLVISQPIWLLWGMSAILAVLAAFILHVVILDIIRLLGRARVKRRGIKARKPPAASPTRSHGPGV